MGAKKKTASTKNAASGRSVAKKATTTADAVKHPAFGEMQIDPANGISWEKTVTVSSRDIVVELTAPPAKGTSKEGLDRVAPFVTRLAAFDTAARAALRKNYDDEGSDSMVAMYRDHHLEELAPEIGRAHV